MAARIRRGITIRRRTFAELKNLRFNSVLRFFVWVRNVAPNFRPRPMEMKIAGSSKIPWGKSLRATRGPAFAVARFRT